MAHKYIKEIIDLEQTPYGYCGEDDDRSSKWREERRIYGFDDRKTWSLDTTFFCWLYERLMRFKEIDFIDLDFHKVNVGDKELTQRQCIDRMLELCKKVITYQGTEEQFEEKNEILDIWKEIIRYMWW